MNKRLSEIFKIISFYDDCRWGELRNYNLINFSSNELDDDSKLLTHWLCYISDRQTGFQRIWDIGGFVFSDLVQTTKKLKSLTLLDPNETKSFIKKEIDGKYTFISSANFNNNTIISSYNDVLEANKVKFKPRFLPSDYLSILYTFIILEDYDFSISKYIKENYENQKNNKDFIKRILFSLYLLTYYEIGRPTTNDVSHFVKILKNGKERKKKIKDILNNSLKFTKEYSIFLKEKNFKQKRAWCSLRDFLKSPEFNKYFINALKKESMADSDINRLISKEALTQLELPGDVWNNNSKFRNCILKDTDYENSKEKLNKILRDYYNDNNKNITGYPEQFDVTFDFVPRMCESDNCDICPIKNIDNSNNFQQVCIDDETKYCPVVLAGCNYKNKCVGKKICKII